MDLHPINTISLFTGSGMLDTAVELALESIGCAAVPLCYVERDSAAAAFIVARMEKAEMGEAPIWDDLSAFDGTIFRPYMAAGILIASPPCQPYSSAGKRAGNDDARSHGENDDGPLVHLIRIIREIGPAMVYFENVGEWVTGGAFQRFGEELSNLGYAIKDPLFLAAEDVGAPHERERVFILATLVNTDGVRRWTLCGSSVGASGRSEELGNTANGGCPTASPESIRTQRRRILPSGRCGEVGNADSEGKCESQRDDAAIAWRNARDHDSRGSIYATGARRDGAGIWTDSNIGGGECVPRNGRHLLPLFPPGRGDGDNPDHPDWWAWAAVAAMDPTAMPRIECEIPTLVAGMARADELRIGGNGVCTLSAAVAFAVLIRRVDGVERENTKFFERNP